MSTTTNQGQNSDFKDFTFGEGDEGIGRKEIRASFEGGRTYRVSMLNFPGLADGTPDLTQKPRFTAADTIYIQNVGYIIAKGPEYAKFAQDGIKKRVGTVIVVWPTDKAGELAKDRLKEAEAFAWMMTGDRYSQILNVAKEWPLGQHDLLLACTKKGKGVAMSPSPCKENLFAVLWAKKDSDPRVKALIDKVIMEAQQIIPQIPREIGRPMTVQQIRDKIAGAGGGDTTGGAAPDSDVPDTAASQAETDALVDNILG